MRGAPKAKLSFRCDAELARAARAKAGREGVPLSEPVRIALRNYVEGTEAPVETARQLGRVVRELVAVGRNINQIARSIHAGFGPRDYARQTEELSRVLAQVVHLIQPLALPVKKDAA